MKQSTETVITTIGNAKTRIRRISLQKRKQRNRIIILASILALTIIIFALFSIIPGKSSVPTEETPSDETAPEISLLGEPEIYLVVGSEYHEDGAMAIDQKSNISIETPVKISGKIDTKTPGDYTITYTSSDRSGNTATATRTVHIINRATTTSNSGHKIIYLTFDDGPGAYTSQLLDVLKKYNVKATFFVTGSGDDSLIAREYNEGHTVGLHTFTHNYASIYSSVDNFFADLYRIQDRVKSITGYTSMITRFPGGSSNSISAYYDGGTHIMSRLVNEVSARGFTYFDWNISSGDAGGTTSTAEVIKNVTSALKPESSVILQHDIKDFSVAAVEQIIQYGLNNGYTFKKLEPSSYTAHHGVTN